MRGVFIVIEGGEGAGKGSVMRFLQERFSAEGGTRGGAREIVFTREPGGSPFAERVRAALFPGVAHEADDADALAVFLAMCAARRAHLRHTILPALARGAAVISDRFHASSWAYNVRAQQSAANEALFHAVHAAVLEGAEPDYHIFLDVAPEEGLRRRARAGAEDAFDLQSPDFHTRVRAGYREFLRTRPHTVIDANRPLEMVCEEAAACVAALLDKGR